MFSLKLEGSGDVKKKNPRGPKTYGSALGTVIKGTVSRDFLLLVFS
jgi:hypothetical protein